jgi:hypothetical protein
LGIGRHLAILEIVLWGAAERSPHGDRLKVLVALAEVPIPLVRKRRRIR